MGYLKQGNSVLVWGRVSGRDASFRQFDSGKCVTNFSVCFGHGEADAQGRKPGKYMDVKVWNDNAHYAACLEKGDTVLVAGELRKEREPDRDGNDRWYLDADFCEAQPILPAEDTPDQPEEPAPGGFEEMEGDYPEVLQ